MLESNGFDIGNFPDFFELHLSLFRFLWMKRKGVARVRLFDDTIHEAEVHWYEAHSIGKRDIKIKRLLD
jgi:hypothetical protein